MRFKMPRIKRRFPVLVSLVVALLFSVVSLKVLANQEQDTDRALFWSIHKSGQVVGYLLGTIHSEDPRVLDFSEDLLSRLRTNRVFAMELVPDLPTLARLNEYMHYPPGQTLESVIGDERFKALTEVLFTYSLPVGFINQMKPWAAMMTLSTPPPETGFFMDLSLSLRASGNGLDVVGLETLEQQLSFLEEMPMSMQLSLLDQAVADFSRVNEVHDQMVDTYLENNLVLLTSLTEEQLQLVGDEASDYFMETGINVRNFRMLDSLLSQLENNTVFAAVGALHLPGEKGLINLLREQGYEVNPMDIPFLQATSTPGE
jgi:uncharacterized protein YbaP (TraB family)